MPPRSSGRPVSQPSTSAMLRATARRIDFERQVLMQAPPEATGYGLILEPQTPGGALEETQTWPLVPFVRPERVRLESGRHYQLRWVDKNGEKLAGMQLSGTSWLHYFDGIADPPVREDEMIDRLLRNNLELRKTSKRQRAKAKKLKQKFSEKKTEWKQANEDLKAELKKERDKFHWRELAVGAGTVTAWKYIPEHVLTMLGEKIPEMVPLLVDIVRGSSAKQKIAAEEERVVEEKQKSEAAPTSRGPQAPAPVVPTQSWTDSPKATQPASPVVQNQASTPGGPDRSPLAVTLKPDETESDALPGGPSRSSLTAALKLARTENSALAGALAVTRCLRQELITTQAIEALRGLPDSELRAQFQRGLVHFFRFGRQPWGPPSDAIDRAWRNVVRPFMSTAGFAIELARVCADDPALAFSDSGWDATVELQGVVNSYDFQWPTANLPHERFEIGRRMLQDLQRQQGIFGKLTEKTSHTNVISICLREATAMLRDTLSRLVSLPSPAEPEDHLMFPLLLLHPEASPLAGAVVVARWLGRDLFTEAEVEVLGRTPVKQLQTSLRESLLHLASMQEPTNALPSEPADRVWRNAGLAFNSICYLGMGIYTACARQKGLQFSIDAIHQMDVLTNLWERYGDWWPVLQFQSNRVDLLECMLVALQEWTEDLNGLPDKTRATKVLVRAARQVIELLQEALNEMASAGAEATDAWTNESSTSFSPPPSAETPGQNSEERSSRITATQAELDSAEELGKTPTAQRPEAQRELAIRPRAEKPAQDLPAATAPAR